jgi:ketosteroid isomerase-like protein
MTSSAETALRAFVACINAQDAAGIVAHCTDDHVFIDSLGSKMSGLARIEQGWAGYFALFPDYRIEIESVATDQDLVLACGFASATHGPTGVAWRIPSAWRARIVDGRVAEWQVYADNKPVYELLSRKT